MSFQVENLTVRYGEAGEPALRDVSLVFEPGVHTSVLGPNGAGKSTLLRALLGILRPDSGQARFEGRPSMEWPRRELARRVALVSATEEFAFPLKVRELVAMGRHPHLGSWRPAGDSDRDIVATSLREVGLDEFSERYLFTLSAGELQRARLARALAQQADTLLLDEPVAHLDLAHEYNTFRQIAQLTMEKSLTTITVTHHLNLASRFSDRVVLLSDGRVAATGTPQEVFTAERLGAAFGCAVDVRDLGELGRFAIPVAPDGDSNAGGRPR
ncbi:MAG: ABC transporter ATP-binding protein [marine benthic group bacterium]|nr:ABC transporter ATP-binding protein [Gemmatimonadota bacterium]